MYDVIIIGRGPAGLSAALYTTRSNNSTLIIGRSDSRLGKAEKLDNYLGFSGTVTGKWLLSESEIQAQRLGAEIIEDEVVSLEMGEHFSVITAKDRYEARCLIIATGQSQKKVSITNLDRFDGLGVSYCSTCDGFFYNGLKVGVLGYKDFAVHEATELLSNTKDITIYTNGRELELKDPSSSDLKQFKIDKRPVEKLEGGEYLENIFFKDGTSEKLDGLFVAYDSATGIDFARKLGIVADSSSVSVDNQQQTNIEGVFAAGDCTGGLKQVATAVGQGAVAGKAAGDFLRKLKTS